MFPAFHLCAMADTKNQQKPAAASERRLRSETIDLPAGLHEWRGHTRDGIPWEVHKGDAAAVLKSFQPGSFDCVVTSPPYYWQRDYGVAGQIGQEKTIEGFTKSIADAMDQVRRVLAADGLLFLNLGDTYYSAKGQPKGADKKSSARRFGLRAVDASGLGVPRKTIIGIPWRVALEMIARGWVLRSPIVWTRKGAIPEPTAKDRPWRTYEMIFMFSKSPRYHFSRAALNAEEDIWTISARRRANGGLHTAAFPEELVQRCIAIGCRVGGRVLDPFAGTGTSIRVALESGRSGVAIDLSEQYCEFMVKELRGL
jgi:DNA modification methylase